MKKYYSFLASIFLLFCTGCIVPIPHQRLHTFGVTAELKDKDTGRPVPDAIIFSLDSDKEFVKTNENGSFNLPPIYKWHGAYFISPISFSIFPNFDLTSPEREFLIYAPGYRVKKVKIVDDKTNGSYLKPGSIKIKK